MRLAFRTKILLSYAVLVVAVVAAVDLYLHRALSSDLRRQLDRRLERHARAAAAWLAEGDPPARVVARVAQAAEARATVVDPSGRVLADSEVADADLPRLENHAGRPEVAAALRAGEGAAARASSTLGVSMRYVAVRAGAGPVVRLAVPLTEVGRTIADMRRRLLWASLVALGIALALGVAVTRVAVRPVRAMTAAAARMAGGEYDVSLPPTARDEFGVLARALESLAGQLRARIGEVTAERDRLAAMLERMVEGVLVIDPDGRVGLANPAAAGILETGPLVGRTVTEAIRHPGACEVFDAAERDGHAGAAELEGVGAARRTVLLNVRRLPAAAGGGAVAVLHDVTRLRRLETVRRDFVANVSHELRTPVASIQGYAETLLDGGLAEPEHARRFVEVIHRNADRLGRLVSDLLTLSRLEDRAPEEIAREPVALADVAGDVVDTVRDQAAALDVRVTVEVPADLVALGDADGVEQMLLNLVDNALKYGRPGGRVRVAAARVDRDVELAVEDDGRGIESRHLPRVFERFYRVDEARSQGEGGTGLGLAIVRHLAESMGGSVSVTSEVGRGSRFAVRLPAAA